MAVGRRTSCEISMGSSKTRVPQCSEILRFSSLVRRWLFCHLDFVDFLVGPRSLTSMVVSKAGELTLEDDT